MALERVLRDIVARLVRLERKAVEDWAREPHISTCQVSISSAQEIATGAPADVTFDTDDYDPDDLHSTVSNTDRITIVVPGVYIITGNTTWEAHDTGTRRIQITVGASAIAGQEGDAGGATITHDQSVAVQKRLAADDIVRLSAYQTSGGGLDLNTCTLEVTRIG